MTACVLSRSLVCLLALTVACGDSDPAGSSGAGGAPTTSAQTTASSSDTSSVASTSASASTSSSAISSSSGGEGGDGGGGAPPMCDMDGDGSDLAGPGCCGSPNPCDCDDNDQDTFPGQTMWFTTPRSNVAPDAPDAFDYDCSGVQEKQYVQDIDGCGLLSCTAAQSFFGDRGEYFCGAPGALLECTLLTCGAVDVIDLGCH